MQNRYWVFQAPVGYRYERSGGQGKVLVRDEPNASILQEALEGYASGRFATQVEVKRFLERQPTFPKDLPNGEIRNQRIFDMLTRTIYTGYIEAPELGRRAPQGSIQRAQALAAKFKAYTAPEPYTGIVKLVEQLTTLRG